MSKDPVYAPAIGIVGPAVVPYGRKMASSLLLVDRRGHETNKVELRGRVLMKAMMLIKIAFVAVIFMLLVMMGLYNRATVDFNLPPLLSSEVQQPAALMYFAFFAVGLITGAILSMGGHKEPKKSNKPS